MRVAVVTGGRDLWVSCPEFTGLVQVDGSDRIYGGAPVFRRFVGQEFYKLLNWLDKFGPVLYKEIDRETFMVTYECGCEAGGHKVATFCPCHGERIQR